MLVCMWLAFFATQFYFFIFCTFFFLFFALFFFFLKDKGWKNFSPYLVTLVIPIILFVDKNELLNSLNIFYYH